MHSSKKRGQFNLLALSQKIHPQHARWALAGGVLLGFLLQDLSAWLYPFFPILIGVLLFLAFVQIPQQQWLQRPSWPLWQSLGVALLAVPLLLLLTPLPEWILLAALMVCCAPSVASAGNLALMSDLDAPYALRFTLLSTLLAPLSALLFLSPKLALESTQAAVFLAQLYATITTVFVLAALAQKRLGLERLQQHKEGLSLLSVLVLTLFAIAIMHGTREALARDPTRALGLLLLAFAVNFGFQGLAWGWRRWQRPEDGERQWTDALLHGNRNAALNYACMPPHPELALFIAFYQIPMYLSPLLINTLRRSQHD